MLASNEPYKSFFPTNGNSAAMNHSLLSSMSRVAFTTAKRSQKVKTASRELTEPRKTYLSSAMMSFRLFRHWNGSRAVK